MTLGDTPNSPGASSAVPTLPGLEPSTAVARTASPSAGIGRPLLPCVRRRSWPRRLVWDVAFAVLKRVPSFRPNLSELYLTARKVSLLAGPLLDLWNIPEEPFRAQCLQEYTEAIGELSLRVPNGAVESVPMAITPTESFFLFSLIRARRPRCVVETGVANGVSTFVFLRALERNGVGHLLSFDVDPRAGTLLRPADTTRWRFAVLPRRGTRRVFREELEREGTIDFFMHDSEHSYRHQYFEFRTALPLMSDHAVLASDDADCSYAFLAFCREHGLWADYLVSERKVLGVSEVVRTSRVGVTA